MITLKNDSKSFDERISNLKNKVMQNAITLRKKLKNGTLFKFKPFSLKQKKILRKLNLLNFMYFHIQKEKVHQLRI